MWKRHQLVEFARRINFPSIFIIDGIELHACFKATREFRNDLSNARCRSLLLISCQKAVWNTLNQPTLDMIFPFEISDNLSIPEARSLVSKLVQSRLLEDPTPKELAQYTTHILEECEGHLVVAMLELVKGGQFATIILSEYENLSDRAKVAYQYVALLHQHGISIPDYLLNKVTIDDWTVFEKEVIRLESELTIVQDVNYTSQRICFQTRHPRIAQVVVDSVVPRHEDRIRMYRKIVASLATSEEDRSFLLSLLTSHQVREEIREPKYIEEFFELALDLFPYDTVFILHLGKFEHKVGNLDRSEDLLRWGLKLDPTDTYILHQLAVCVEKKARHDTIIASQNIRFQEAQKLYRTKQQLDPLAHFGYTSEAKMHLHRANNETDTQARVNLLSAADEVIRRGQDLVREDHKSYLKECAAQLSSALGDRLRVIKTIGEMDAKNQIRYASSYSLLAACLVEMKREEEALSIVRKGLEAFPGDRALISLLLQLLEQRLHESTVRNECLTLIERYSEIPEFEVKLLFIKAVVEYYDNKFSRSHDSFASLGAALSRRGPRKIRLFYCLASGTPVERDGPCFASSKGTVYVTDTQSGLEFPLDSMATWALKGKPSAIVYHLGFSLMGPRATLISSKDSLT